MIELSPQERKVVMLVGRDGAHWKTVARKMGISQSTVRVYVGRILAKVTATRAPRDTLIAMYHTEFSPAAQETSGNSGNQRAI